MASSGGADDHQQQVLDDVRLEVLHGEGGHRRLKGDDDGRQPGQEGDGPLSAPPSAPGGQGPLGAQVPERSDDGEGEDQNGERAELPLGGGGVEVEGDPAHSVHLRHCHRLPNGRAPTHSGIGRRPPGRCPEAVGIVLNKQSSQHQHQHVAHGDAHGDVTGRLEARRQPPIVPPVSSTAVPRTSAPPRPGETLARSLPAGPTPATVGRCHRRATAVGSGRPKRPDPVQLPDGRAEEHHDEHQREQYEVRRGAPGGSHRHPARRSRACGSAGQVHVEHGRRHHQMGDVVREVVDMILVPPFDAALGREPGTAPDEPSGQER